MIFPGHSPLTLSARDDAKGVIRKIDVDGLKQSGEELVDITFDSSVKSIGPSAFAYCDDLESVVLPEGLERIEADAFRGCMKLKRIALPRSLVFIGNEAFLGCISLQGGKFPKGIREIGEYAFAFCPSLREIILPNSIKTPGKGLFSHCEQLQRAKLPKYLENLPDKVFDDCISLELVILPARLLTIGESAFRNCNSLEKIDVPSSLTEIKESAFQNCVKLVDFPLSRESVKIAPDSFDGCPAFSRPSDSDTVWHEKTLAEEDMEELERLILKPTQGLSPHQLEGRKDIFGVEPESFLLDIPEYVCAGCTSLRILLLQGHTRKIGDAAFSECKSLLPFTIPECLEEIGQCAFFNCEQAFRVLRLPPSMRRIGWGAFFNCKSMTELMVENGLEEIAESAFNGCTSLRRAVLADSVRVIGKEAFFGCESLSQVVLPSNLRAIGSGAFSFCTKLERIVFPEGLERIDLLPEGYEPVARIRNELDDELITQNEGAYLLLFILLIKLRNAGLATDADIEHLKAVHENKYDAKDKQPSLDISVDLAGLDPLLPGLRTNEDPIPGYIQAEANLELHAHALKARMEKEIFITLSRLDEVPPAEDELLANALHLSREVLKDSSVKRLLFPFSLELLDVPFFDGCDSLEEIRVHAGTEISEGFRAACDQKGIRIVVV